ncbi:hypothetical protein [Saccharicrinis sp. FJH54]|uniref:hypothetical protein n=1 Tax=Saccharicrinis sp. FJH54 TaxID=3344665 RepID=UPI0035D4ECE4
MKRKNYSILYLFLIFNFPVIAGQFNYAYNGAIYMLSSNRTTLFSDVTFNQTVSSSRMRTAQISQARLKSAELMGLYLIFSEHYPKEQQIQAFFPLFVKHYGKSFNTEVSDLKTIRNPDDSNIRNIRFECPVKTYDITGINISDLPDLKSLCEQEYRFSRDIYSAERFLTYCTVSPADQLRMNAGFLSRQNAPLPAMAKCFGLEPGTIFESSLFGSADALQPLVYELLAEKEVADEFPEYLLLTDLITVSPGIDEKDSYYLLYLKGLENSDELWNDILLFASDYANKTEPSDVFNAIQRYPGALNMHLFSGYNSDFYNHAIQFFNENRPDSALISLQDAINFNGVTVEKISLAAAVYRLQQNYEKALLMSVFSAFSGIENAYVPGNIYLSLQALGYKKTEELKQYFLNSITCDTWSRKVISDN